MSPDVTDVDAPHGRDDQGVPLAPYGYRADGRPKLSNRGRQPKAAAPQKKAEKNTTAGPVPGSIKAQKRALMELSDQVLVGAAAVVTTERVQAKLGPHHGTAAAGSVVILGSFIEPVADVVAHMAVDRPYLLSWLDGLDDKMPYLAMFKVAGQLGKALVANWQRPDPRLAAAAKTFAAVRAVQFAQQIEQQAAEMGLTDEMVAEMMAGGPGPEQQEPGAVRQEPSEENGWNEFAFRGVA